MELHISVRNLVEFIFRSGDIDNRRTSAAQADAMQEGSRIHRKIQKGMGDSYQAEVPLLYVERGEDYDLAIEGRADGIFTGEYHADGERLPLEEKDQALEAPLTQTPERFYWVDEIKGMYRDLDTLEEPIYVHKAQAMCYAYIFAEQHGLEQIGVQMTYCNLDTEDTRYFQEVFSFEQLSEWFLELMRQYRKWADFQYEWKVKRQASIKTLQFPYEYRKGQQKLAGDVYRTILREKILFLQAPTGVGKTISTVFPAVKAVGEELADRIFYLTAKTVTASVARETFRLLQQQGYRGKIIQITAKEKLCLCDEMECNPIHCPYAKGHYDRVNDAVYDLLCRCDLFTREEILAQADSYQVCPFEMSLDIAGFADDIICDYNYAFDPNVCLKRFFQEGVRGDYIFLVDEAHNLVERARQMYSATIVKEDILAAKKIFKKYSKRIERQLEKCNRSMLELKRESDSCCVRENISSLYFPISRLMAEMDEFLQKPVDFPERREILEFYFSVRDFVNIYELADDHYVIYSGFEEDGRFFVRLFCVDPSANLQRCLDKARATVFFSATLLPISYYKSILSEKKDNYAIYAESTFSQEQSLLLIGRDVSSRYTRRNDAEFARIAAYIDKTIRSRKGNYMVFFPSYKLMGQVYEAFEKLQGEHTGQLVKKEKACDGEALMVSFYGKEAAIMQQTGRMGEAEREAFLAEFETEHTYSLAAFCVMGGIFGEGIDLKQDRLIGAIVVGTGIPQIGDEREILKEYYDKRSGNGFDYAYRFPGLNKVLQAAGRVIRTAEDRGVILLLDERFLHSEYEPLYPREWSHRQICTLETAEEKLAAFWDVCYNKCK